MISVNFNELPTYFVVEYSAGEAYVTSPSGFVVNSYAPHKLLFDEKPNMEFVKELEGYGIV